MYEMDYLAKLVATSNELESHTYYARKGSSFIVNERGKQRNIRSNPFSDRVVRRSLCDECLTPTLRQYLIHDNGASLPGKGISFTRRRFEQHLHEFYRKHGNEGYILLIDFSKYYDNIQHQKLRDKIKKYIKDEEILWLFDKVLENFKIDVSYLNDELYSKCLDMKFDGDKQSKLNPKYLTGEKFMEKSLAIGDQVSQICSIFFPTEIDNYCKIIRSIRFYGRYMDDSYIISNDKNFLHEMLNEITKIANKLGIFINEKKTRIMKLNQPFTYLKLRYKLTSTGHLVKRINPQAVTRERRKLKKYRGLVDDGRMSLEDAKASFKSWYGSYEKLLSYRTKNNMRALYNELFAEHS
ncbi:MAG: RNA-directed DNA polymerase [Lactobacillus crispatus]|nr:RNA-directed DNA polymerase [Lactobacillus crispatus]MCI1364339.1 RNA-directed DNA polymerase [Lactobacillus crispatus]